jgi:hypothetical protein
MSGGTTYFVLELLESCVVVIFNAGGLGYGLAFCLLFLILVVSLFFLCLVIWSLWLSE